MGRVWLRQGAVWDQSTIRSEGRDHIRIESREKGNSRADVIKGHVLGVVNRSCSASLE